MEPENTAIEADRKRRGEPVAWAVFADNGNIRIWCADPIQAETLKQQYGNQLKPLYDAPQPADPSGAPTLRNADSGAQNGVQAPQPAEPVKVPSDADLFAIHDEYFPTMVLGHENYLSFARAILARYGQPTLHNPARVAPNENRTTQDTYTKSCIEKGEKYT